MPINIFFAAPRTDTTDIYAHVFLAKCSVSYVMGIVIAARYNAWLPYVCSTHLKTLLASAMAPYTYITDECMYCYVVVYCK